jgi:hypothetical protein
VLDTGLGEPWHWHHREKPNPHQVRGNDRGKV